MNIGAIAKLTSIDKKNNSLHKALDNPTLHRIPTLMMVERFKIERPDALLEKNKNTGE